jgi:LuxR family transcriptional activator of conjugal transfer of Ti plasmids
MNTNLTAQEKEILTGLANGKTVKQIAQNMNRIRKTIDYHIAQARRKLQARTRDELIARAVFFGLIKVDTKGMEI